jgi:hypothetical protein
MSRKSVQRFCDNDMHKQQPKAHRMRQVKSDALWADFRLAKRKRNPRILAVPPELG